MLDDGLKGLVGHPPQPGEHHVGKARHTCARVLAAVPAGEGGDQFFICCEAPDSTFLPHHLYSHNGQHGYLFIKTGDTQ